MLTEILDKLEAAGTSDLDEAVKTLTEEERDEFWNAIIEEIWDD